jgi:hypothetical protein
VPGFANPGGAPCRLVSMSKREFSRLEVLLQVQFGRLRVVDACELIGVRRRQIFRLLRGLTQGGATSLPAVLSSALPPTSGLVSSFPKDGVSSAGGINNNFPSKLQRH